MEDAQTILVIITASLLSIFLLIGIVATVMIVKLVRSVRRTVVKAEGFIDSAESVTAAFKNVNGPLTFIKLVRNIVSLANNHKK